MNKTLSGLLPVSIIGLSTVFGGCASTFAQKAITVGLQTQETKMEQAKSICHDLEPLIREFNKCGITLSAIPYIAPTGGAPYCSVEQERPGTWSRDMALISSRDLKADDGKLTLDKASTEILLRDPAVAATVRGKCTHLVP